MSIHRTALADAAVHPSGWFPLPGMNVEITRLPLVDLSKVLPDGSHLFARLTHADAKAWAAANGAALPLPEHLEALRAAGLWIEPSTINPDTQQLDGSVAHDSRVWAKIRGANWDGRGPVCGAGKHHTRGAPPGRAYLGGWWTFHLEWYTPPPGQPGHRSGAGWIQPLEQPDSGPGPHDDGIFDYATLTILVRPVPPTAGDTPPDTEPSPTTEPSPQLIDPAAAMSFIETTIDAVMGALAEPFREIADLAGWHGPDAPDHPAGPAVPRRRPAVRTPATAAEMLAAIASLAPELGPAGERVLLAHSALETDRWRAMWGDNVGNAKHTAAVAGDWQLFACNEILTPQQAAACVAGAVAREPRRPEDDPAAYGPEPFDAVTRSAIMAGTTHAGGVIVWFFPPSPYCAFRSFLPEDPSDQQQRIDALARGMTDHLALLRHRFGAAWAAAQRGDPAAYCDGLKAAGYMTADLDPYRRGVVSLFRQFANA